MGNQMDIKAKEGGSMSEITEAVVSNFKYHMNLVDHSLSGFARVIDAMTATCKILLENVEKYDSAVKTSNATEASPHITFHLLELLNTTVSDQKLVLLESMSRFFHFMIDQAANNVDYSKQTPIEYEIDAYMAKTNMERSENSVKTCQSPSEKILLENIETRKAFETERDKVTVLTERNETYVTEMKRVTEKNEELEKALHIVKDKLENETASKGERIRELTIELDKQKRELGKSREKADKQTKEHHIQLSKLSDNMKLLEDVIDDMKKPLHTNDDNHAENDDVTTKCSTVSFDSDHVTDEHHTDVSEFEKSLQIIHILDMKVKKVKEIFERGKHCLEQNLINRADKVTHSSTNLQLDEAIQLLSVENDTLRKDLENQLSKIECLEKKLEKAEGSCFTPVQLYIHSSLNSGNVKNDLLALLKIKLEVKNKNLKIVEVRKPIEVQLDIPTLILCCQEYYTNRFYRGSHPILEFLRGFKVTHKMALAIFHRTHSAFEEDPDLRSFELGEIFNFRYGTNYQFFVDNNIVDSIVGFITNRSTTSTV